MRNIQIDAEHAEIVKKILKLFITPEITIWVFGSRATNSAKKFSDLDLALEAPNHKKIDPQLVLSLEAAFDGSLLPWKVEIVDYNNLDAGFKKIIEQDKIRLDILTTE